MAATMLVFENNNERCSMSADLGHDWEHQPRIFGAEEEKLLKLCDELFNVALHSTKEARKPLLKRIYGIAKSHKVHITWYGTPGGAFEPDRFLVSGHGHRELAFIQC